jgi:2-oxoglutarate ferredoxin oxidoreductase subunit alpha
MDTPDLDGIRLEMRALPGSVEGYARFEETDSGVSPMMVPGTPGGMFMTTGLEHDEHGLATYTPENRERMVAKRYRKMETLSRELVAHGDGLFEDDGSAAVGVIGWGSTEGTISEALGRLRKEGARIAQFHPKVLNPLPVPTIERFLAPLKKVIVLEENHTAQLAQHLRAHVSFNGTEIVTINQCTGLPFTADEVVATLGSHV